jgi:thioredoxin-like negative regulator of GroEL
MISPLFEKFAAAAPADKIAFYKVDVDEQEQISQEVGIKAMPTFVFFKNGQKLSDVVGANPQKLQVSVSSLDSSFTSLTMHFSPFSGRHPAVQLISTKLPAIFAAMSTL